MRCVFLFSSIYAHENEGGQATKISVGVNHAAPRFAEGASWPRSTMKHGTTRVKFISREQLAGAISVDVDNICPSVDEIIHDLSASLNVDIRRRRMIVVGVK